MAVAKASRRVLAWLAIGVAAGLLAIIGLYFANPLGTASWDVRARMLGYSVYRMPSISMQPTLEPGDVVMADTAAYRSLPPARGEVIIYFPPPQLNANPFIGRVVAVGGERMEMRAGVPWVDGQPQPLPPGAAPAVAEGPGRDMQPLTVPPGQVFIMGDHRDHSLDSRYFGPVPREDIVGRMSRVIR